MKFKKNITCLLIASFIVVSQMGCAKNRAATGEEIAVGLGGGAIIGQIIVASTPATLAGALLGTLFGIVILDLSDEKVAVVVDTVEPSFHEQPPVVIQNDPMKYHIRPHVKTAAINQNVVWCRDAKVQRKDTLEEKIIAVKICRDEHHWFIMPFENSYDLASK